MFKFGLRLVAPLAQLSKSGYLYVDLDQQSQTLRPDLPAKPPNASRIVCLSDIHTLWDHISIPEGDTLVIAGDLTMTEKTAEADLVEFQKFLVRQSGRFKDILVIGGNHDLILQRLGKEECQARMRPAHYLENDRFTSQDGLEFFGSPWSPPEMKTHTAFQFQEPHNSAFLAPLQALPPGSVDVLVTHAGGYRDNDLRPLVAQLKPRLALSGHYHSEFGVKAMGDTAFINCASVNVLYLPNNPVVVADLVPRKR